MEKITKLEITKKLKEKDRPLCPVCGEGLYIWHLDLERSGEGRFWNCPNDCQGFHYSYPTDNTLSDMLYELFKSNY